MKSTAASQRTLRALLIDSTVSLILLADDPAADRPTAVSYDGAAPVPVTGWQITGRRATNADTINLPRNRGSTTARVAAWALVDASGAWVYGDRFARAFDIRPNDEPYLAAGDIVIED